VLVLGAAGCGKQTEKLYSPAKTRACLADAGVRLGGKLDFVATTATGGALKAHLGSNFVTVVFGETVADADNINQAYHRFSSSNVGVDDVLRQQDNAVMLWHEHPSDQDLALITSCLK
jgi:phage terminase large subunit-like protein